MVHEHWHSTSAPKHTDGTNGTPSETNSCSGGDRRCDVFQFGAPTRNEEYYGLIDSQNDGVSSYQMDQRWTCDIVEEPAAWLPLIVQMTANQHFYERANQSRFTNPEIPGGFLPYDCGLAESLLSVPADGTTLCPETDTLRCNEDIECIDTDRYTTDFCSEGCCVHEVFE